MTMQWTSKQYDGSLSLLQRPTQRNSQPNCISVCIGFDSGCRHFLIRYGLNCMAYPPPTAPASLSGMPPTTGCYCMPGWLAMALRLSCSLVEAGGQRKWVSRCRWIPHPGTRSIIAHRGLRPFASGGIAVPPGKQGRGDEQKSTGSAAAEFGPRAPGLALLLTPRPALTPSPSFFAPSPIKTAPSRCRPSNLYRTSTAPPSYFLGPSTLPSHFFGICMPSSTERGKAREGESQGGGKPGRGKQGGISHLRCRPYYGTTTRTDSACCGVQSIAFPVLTFA